MGKMNITLNDELEEQFRDAVASYLGFKKGNLQIAIEEALKIWIKSKEEKENVRHAKKQ